MTELLKKLYRLLFWKCDRGFMLLCYAMLIPCALNQEFCRWWMLFMSAVLVLVIQANAKGWNKISAFSPSRTEEEIRASLSPEARELYDKVLDDIRMNEED